VDALLEEVVNLAKIDIPIGNGSYATRASITNVSLLGGDDMNEFIPGMQGRVNEPGGLVLPTNVWVRLEIFEFDLTQWGGLQKNLGDIQQGW